MSAVPRLPPGMLAWERCMRAAEAVHQRMLKAAAALSSANVDYAVIGGNAVASWVGSVDEGAVRSTRDVDILLRRSDLEAAKTALAAVGFAFHETMDVPMFIDDPKGGARNAVHVLFANEKVQPKDLAPAADVAETIINKGVRFLSLEALVRMKLTSYRRKDQVHVLDMIGVGLIDRSWPARFPPELAERLQILLDDPNG
jgi:hypothetical protein